MSSITEKIPIQTPTKSPTSRMLKHEYSNQEYSYELRTDGMIMDPANSTPPSDFMNQLKKRMHTYFATELKQPSS